MGQDGAVDKVVDTNGSKITPAVIIILVMVLINAGLFFYFDHRTNVADERIQDNVSRIADFAQSNRVFIQTLENERAQRTDQNCELFERDHLADVRDLRQTYKFLASEVAAETPGLTRFVILNLPRTEMQAKTDIAPKYCDDPGLGLPEPDPKIPERPQKLEELTRTITPQS